MGVIFGPVASRRFGLSLGIDLSPSRKQCNFDCLYCELAAAAPVETIDNPPAVEQIITELEAALDMHPNIDVITLTANGEPTLYPHLEALIDGINSIKGRRQTLILSNASTIADPKIQKALTKLDTVKLSLDCVTPECFKKLDRPIQPINIQFIIDGIRTFRRHFNDQMVLEILMVRGLNDTDTQIAAFNRILPTLGADRIDLGTVDRPPAYPVEPLSYREMHAVAQRFRSDLPVHITARHPSEPVKQHFDEEAILSTLAKRPLTLEDIENLFDDESLQRFRQLLSLKKITQKTIGSLTFYGSAFNLQKSKNSPKNP